MAPFQRRTGDRAPQRPLPRRFPHGSRPIPSPCAAHVDCDLYESTAEALRALALIVPGTVLLFDEYLMNPHWQSDEHKALVEVGTALGWTWRYAAFSLFSHQAVVVVTGS